MAKAIRCKEVSDQVGGYYMILLWLGAAIVAGLASAFFMEHNGHHVTGMTNRIVWGTPHVFAVFLIVAASGALNVASVSSVFGKKMYKPLARLSGVVAISLLVGGLSVLVLDLGRPDRLIVAMTTYNFKSIFAWNIYLYTGFMVVVVIYLWMQMELKMNRFVGVAGLVAFLWRLALTTGTGSIFGFLVARQAYDAAIMAPMFIVMSLSFGTAAFILVTVAAFIWTGRPIGGAVLRRLGKLLGLFVAVVLYFVAVQHLTNLYAAEHGGVERFVLLDGGIYTKLFWVLQVGIGSLVPLFLLFHPQMGRRCGPIVAASALVIVGGLAQVYVIIIGGQAYPLELFPGMTVSSSTFDGQVAAYAPSLPEVLLGIGGVALALALMTVAAKVMPILPVTLADADIDPHHKPEPEPEPEPAAAADDAGDGGDDDEAEGDEAPQPA